MEIRTFLRKGQRVFEDILRSKDIDFFINVDNFTVGITFLFSTIIISTAHHERYNIFVS